MASGQAISAFARLKRDVASQLEYLVEQEAKRSKHPAGLLGQLSRVKSFFGNMSVADVTGGLSRAMGFVYRHARKWLLLQVKEFCDFFEIDYEPPQLQDGAEDDGEGEEAEDEEGEGGGLGEEYKQGDTENSGAEGRDTDNSEGPSRRGTATAGSVKQSMEVGAGAGAGAGAFGSVDGFASVKAGQSDNVIGFHDDF
jgi:hypothetical protein